MASALSQFLCVTSVNNNTAHLTHCTTLDLHNTMLWQWAGMPAVSLNQTPNKFLFNKPNRVGHVDLLRAVRQYKTHASAFFLCTGRSHTCTSSLNLGLRLSDRDCLNLRFYILKITVNAVKVGFIEILSWKTLNNKAYQRQSGHATLLCHTPHLGIRFD